MTLRSHRTHLTIMGLAVVACVLAGCGRKGMLEAPPGASALQQEPGLLADPNDATSAATAQGNVYDPVSRTSQTPTAPKGQNKRIILDRLLD